MKRATSLCYFKTVVLRVEHQDPLLKYRFLAPLPAFLILQVWDGVWNSAFLTDFQVMPMLPVLGPLLRTTALMQFLLRPNWRTSFPLTGEEIFQICLDFFCPTWSPLYGNFVLVFLQLSKKDTHSLSIFPEPVAICFYPFESPRPKVQPQRWIIPWPLCPVLAHSGLALCSFPSWVCSRVFSDVLCTEGDSTLPL